MDIKNGDLIELRERLEYAARELELLQRSIEEPNREVRMKNLHELRGILEAEITAIEMRLEYEVEPKSDNKS